MMGMLQHRDEISLWRDARGFTLPEVRITIAIMGIVFAIASSVWFGTVERRAVDSAANQLASDTRFAHTSVTNQSKVVVAEWADMADAPRALR